MAGLDPFRSQVLAFRLKPMFDTTGINCIAFCFIGPGNFAFFTD